ncbi:hypothetical protein WN944_011591 [Citrus x changshan-huyou]|uniref:Uncharacterized protein n=1 Tax=Citrus x changshan-huyou TaxID=2935761 RepID=A0AAP0MVZ5_9ROSI
MGNVGYRISRNGSGKNVNAIILWDRVPAFPGDGYQLRIHLWSVSVSDRFMLPSALLVPLIVPKEGSWQKLHELGADRSSVTKVLEILEGSIDDLQMPPKPFSSSSLHIFGREIESDSSTELLMTESVKEWSFRMAILRAWAGLFKAQAQARITQPKPRPFKSPPNLDGPNSGQA